MDYFDIKELITFCKVVELKSFSEAANYLCVTQPTVSLQINKLEKNLGITLINREGKNIELTYAGKIFYKKAQKILKEIKETQAIIEQIKGYKKGFLIIGSSSLPGEYILPDVITEFHLKYPEIEIFLNIKDTFTIIEEINRGNFDFGIVGSYESHPNLEFKKLLKDEIILIGKNNKKLPDEIEIKDLKNFSFIFREMTSGTLYSVSKKINLNYLPHKITVGSLEAQKKLVRNGIGLAFISKYAVEEGIGRDFKMINVKGITPINRYFYFVKKKNHKLSQISKEFLDIMLKLIQN